MAVSFKGVSKYDMATIFQIVDRAAGVARNARIEYDRLGASMDIAAVHAKTPLRLEELLEADAFNFTHDVFGIHRHIDRDTGDLGGCFLPRFTSRRAALTQEPPI